MAPSQVVVGGPGYSFARYIPGAKPAPKPATEAAGTLTRFEDEPGSSSPKRKREVVDNEPSESPVPESKKARKSKRKDRGVVESSGPAGDEVKTDANEVNDKKEKRAKKEKKSKSRKDSSVDTAPQSNGDAATDRQDKEAGGVEDEAGASQPKKERKEKRKRPKEPVDNSSSKEIPEDPDTMMADAPSESQVEVETQASETKKNDKEKKRKEKKRKDEDEGPEDDAAVDEEKEGRHKMVLDRKTKSLKLAEEAAKRLEDEVKSSEEPEEVHELGPLPQPKLAPVVEPKLTYETLPSWLAAPIRVSQSKRTPFADLGVLPKAVRVLEEKGYPDAFAVQTSAIPLLLPTSKQQPGDLLISAATGSGKTLAYALPVVRDISQGFITRLRALVVLPTRELVKQAQEVFELCAKAYEGGDRKRVRIGIAVGSQTLRSEQDMLVESQRRYDPAAYQKLLEERSQLNNGDAIIDTELGRADPRLGPWEGEVVDFSSKVDVLICTPGRLVEHLEQTSGFSLDYVRWLVVDEADKLLAQSFQGWLDVVLEKFQTSKFSAREFPDMDLDGVRKVVLSATLTRDLSLLSQLALRRPQLIVLEDDGEAGTIAEHSLPTQLEEFAVRVHDVNLKPLYLLDLLQSAHMKGGVVQPTESGNTEVGEGASDTSSDTSSDEDSDTSSEDDSSNSGSESGSDSGNKAKRQEKKKPDGQASSIPTTLIFTKSNESALRLSRLLTLLDPALSAHLSTLTSTTPTHIRRKTLRAFSSPSSPLRLIIASDLVARGIDIPQLDHVINYDLPPSVAGYVHRVGRTARAGRSGRAWTLVGDEESGWFWGRIAKGSSIRRAQKVDRVRIEEMDESKVSGYEAVLEKLGQEAQGTRRM